MYKGIIETVESVGMFFDYLVKHHSLNFHPDSMFEDYVKCDNSQAFSPSECKHYNNLMDQCFDICEKQGCDIYDIGIESLKKCNIMQEE